MNKLRITAAFIAALMTVPTLSGYNQSEGSASKDWATIEDACRLGAPGCATLLQQYIENNSTSMHVNEARLLLADIEFNAHRWPEALNLYRKADIKGLDKPRRSLYSYRLALSLIRTGHFAEARAALTDVKGKEYADIRNFYNAYIDYIGGDFSKAYSLFSKVTPGIKGLEAGYYMLQIEYVRGNYSEVAKKGDRMLKRNPIPELAPEIHRICGLSRFKLGEMETARISLHNYLSQAKGEYDSEALYALGVINYNDGDYSRAIERLTPVTEADGALGQSAWLYIGQCRLQLSDIRGATLALEKASTYETDPKVAQTALYNYITALTRGGNIPFSRSAELLEAYLQRWPSSPYVHQVEKYLASAYFNDHNYQKAVQCVNAVQNPSQELLSIKQKALYQQGIIEATNGNYSKSAGYFKESAGMRGCDATIATQSLLWLGDAHYAEGRYEDAAQCYNKFLSAKPKINKALGYYNLAYAQYRLGEYNIAAGNFEKAFNSGSALPGNMASDAKVRRADCLYYTGNYAEAQRLYSGEADNRSNNDYAAYRNATMCGLTATPRQKVAALEQFLRDYPSSQWRSRALLELAQTYEDLGDSRAAADAYSRRLAINPDVDIDELISAAKANDKAGVNPEQQLILLERIRNSADLPAEQLYDISLYTANALARTGRDTEADDIYRSLSANPENLAGAIATVTLADRMLKRKEYREAYDLMNEFTETGTPHTYWLARGFISLADACTGLGKPELAREYISSLRDNYPGNEPDILSAIESRLNRK